MGKNEKSKFRILARRTILVTQAYGFVRLGLLYTYNGWMFHFALYVKSYKHRKKGKISAFLPSLNATGLSRVRMGKNGIGF